MWSFKTFRNPDQKIQVQAREALQKLLKRQDLGFFNKAHLTQALAEVQDSRPQLQNYDELVVIGLGGSSLGARSLIEALIDEPERQKIHFLDNVDSYTLEKWLDQRASRPRLAWILCSKSGSTIEALALYDFCSQYFQQEHKIDIAHSTWIVSEDKDSLITQFAKQNDRPILRVPFDVGGRYSVFTPVGLLPASFFSLDLEGFIRGCLYSLDHKQMVEEVIAQVWMSHLLGEKTLYSFQYSDRLNTFGLWLQQLWSESLGKAKTKEGKPAPSAAVFVPCRGASDQHSVLQQIVEGPEKKMVCFHRVDSSEAGGSTLKKSRFNQSLLLNRKIGDLMATQAEATEQSIRESQAGTMVLKLEKLNPESIGALLMLWMLVIGSTGELLEINAFDQPGVESGKAITRRVLSQVD